MEDLPWIPLKPSRIARHLHGGVAVLAILALWCSALPWWLNTIMTLLLAAAARWRWQRDTCLLVSGLACREGTWLLRGASGELRAELVGEQVVLPWLVVLQWRDLQGNKPVSLSLWPDSAVQDDLRRLRVFLRYR